MPAEDRASVIARLRRRAPLTVIGFAAINLFTFGVDLSLLVLLHSWFRWPLALSITVSYSTAFALSYALNRRFNFRSHAPVGPQLRIYVVAVAINYVLFILGVGDGLTHAGLDYRLSRIAAGLCEAVYMYSVMRWLVFPDRSR